ncbi:hypothetical protein [Reticulibacter mediterranei]|uniref:hypothetical protein n=1 Tax=Reticulibacter mediterranei TaxID=2778369 RepID=UPI001C68AB01|nr:hypothetical protein [Reticulibacter mediterranei]
MADGSAIPFSLLSMSQLLLCHTSFVDASRTSCGPGPDMAGAMAGPRPPPHRDALGRAAGREPGPPGEDQPSPLPYPTDARFADEVGQSIL